MAADPLDKYETKAEQDLVIARWCHNQAQANKLVHGLAANGSSRVPVHLLFALACLVGVLLIASQSHSDPVIQPQQSYNTGN